MNHGLSLRARQLLPSMAVAVLVLAQPLARAGVGQETSARMDAQSVVKRYCQFDAAGKGLSSEGWVAYIQPLTVWQDGPGWDTSVVIKGYDVGTAKLSTSGARVPVTYELIGELSDSDNGPRLREQRGRKTVTFKLIRSKARGQWTITEPQDSPHISIDTAKEVVRTGWGEGHQQERRALIRQLETEASSKRAKEH